MTKRKVARVEDNHLPQFAGYETDDQGNIQKHVRMYLPVSQCIEVCELCTRIGVALACESDCYGVRLPDGSTLTAGKDIYRHLVRLQNKRILEESADAMPRIAAERRIGCRHGMLARTFEEPLDQRQCRLCRPLCREGKTPDLRGKRTAAHYVSR